MTKTLVYHVPPSFYSQIARLALCELGVEFETALVPPGPPGYDAYLPWYLKLNPMGTVPTLVHGDEAVPDSRAILRYAEEHLSERALSPTDPVERSQSERWIDALYAISVRELSYGSDRARSMGAWVNRKRLGVLAKRKTKHPELSEVYARKIDDISTFASNSADPEVVARHRQQVEETLSELNTELGSRTWLAGGAYSLADVVWTVGVSRLIMLGLDPLRDRPALAAWYARVKARPSFARADVWERPKPFRMLRAASWHYRRALLLILGVSGLATWWLARG